MSSPSSISRTATPSLDRPTSGDNNMSSSPFNTPPLPPSPCHASSIPTFPPPAPPSSPPPLPSRKTKTTPDPLIANDCYLASYTQLPATKFRGRLRETILVPGCPSLWTPRDNETVLLAAEGSTTPSAAEVKGANEDRNRSKHPKNVFATLEASVRAIRTIQGRDLAWYALNMIATRSALALLLQTVLGSIKESFRLCCVDVAGCVLLVPLDEDAAKRTSQPNGTDSFD
jgi:hypothetical protein